MTGLIEKDPYFLQRMQATYGGNSEIYKLQQFVSSSEYPLLIPETVNEAIQTLFEPNLVGRQLCSTLNPANPTYSWIKEGNFDIQILSEGAEPDRSRLQYEKFTIRLFKIGHAIEYPREMLEDAEIDVMGRHIAKVVQAIARKEDEFIFSVMLNGVADGSNDFKTGSEISNHILDGSTGGGWTVPSGTAALTHEKLTVCMQIGETEGKPFNAAVMHPAQKFQLMKLQEFRDSRGYLQVMTPRAEAIMDTGGLNMAPLGFDSVKIYSSYAMDQDKILFMDTNSFASFIERRPLTTYELSDNLTDVIGMSFFERVGAAVTDPEAAVLLRDLDYSNPVTHAYSA